jgi:hypothetical protein
MSDLPFQPTETIIATGNNRLDSIAERHAKRLLDRVQSGSSLADAAKAERMTMSQLKDPNNPVRASVEQLIGGYFLPPEARKQMVRAGLNKMFLDNVNSTDPGNAKLALDAAKQISLDPEVGLQADQSGGVIINIGDLEGVFKQLQASKAPEVSDGRPREDRVLEGEFEDIPGPGSEPVPVPDVPE